MSKICKNCGYFVEPTDRICPRCQAPLEGAASTRLEQAVERSSFREVPVTMLLIGAIVAVRILGGMKFGPENVLNPSDQLLHLMGALEPSRVLAGETWRLIACGFLHIGIWHIAFNMAALFQAGAVVEREVGSVRFFATYILCLLAGAGTDMVFGQASVGASGAVFGLIGCGMTFAHFYGEAGRPQRNFFLQWAVYGLIFGLAVGADNYAHLGGFLAGCCLGFWIQRQSRQQPEVGPGWKALALLCLAATIYGFVGMGLSLLY